MLGELASISVGTTVVLMVTGTVTLAETGRKLLEKSVVVWEKGSWSSLGLFGCGLSTVFLKQTYRKYKSLHIVQM